MLGRNQPAGTNRHPGKESAMDRLRRMPTPLLAVLAASLLANLVLLGLLFRPPQRPDVSGAYALGTDVSSLTEDDRYLVVYDDGGYLLYQRYQVLDSGRYSAERCWTAAAIPRRTGRAPGSASPLTAGRAAIWPCLPGRIPATSPTGTPASGSTAGTGTPPRLSLGPRRFLNNLNDKSKKGGARTCRPGSASCYPSIFFTGSEISLRALPASMSNWRHLARSRTPCPPLCRPPARAGGAPAGPP